ncbi:hypothetical protein ACP4OV_012352 [Aristida adscensionis]
MTDSLEVADLREHILQLFGITCHDEEEKSRTELLEKLNKCKRDPLIELCRSFGITGSRANRKEELVSFLMKFSKDQSSRIDGTNHDKKVKKRRHMKEDADLSSGKPFKKTKREGTALATQGEMEADDSMGVQDRTNYSESELKDNRCVRADHKKGKFPSKEASLEPSEMINDSMPENLNAVSPHETSVPTNEQASLSTPFAKLLTTAEGDSTAVKTSKKKNSFIAKKNTTPREDRKVKASGFIPAKGKPESKGDSKPRKQAPKPTKDELREAIFLILDTADFATMTFGEVVKKVDKHFGKDLFERKPLIRSLIEEELFRLAEEAEKKELEEEEAAEAKARAEQAAKERAKDRTVESGKLNELQSGQDGKTKDTTKNEIGNTIDKGVNGGASAEAADNRNSNDAVESLHDAKGDSQTKNGHNTDELSKGGKAEKVTLNVNGDDAAQGTGKGETVHNINIDSIQVSKDGNQEVVSYGENVPSEDGRADKGRSKNGINNEDVNGCDERSNSQKNAERAECAEDVIEKNGNSEIVVISGDKDGKQKKAI